MYKLILGFLLLSVFAATAQVNPVLRPDSISLDTLKSSGADTLKPKYINLGKIQGRRAALSSAMIPGLGQIRNGVTFYRLLKVAGIYAGGTMLTLSYIDNSKNYKDFLAEIQYRSDNDGDSPPGSLLARYPESGLLAAKDTFRRNREVVIFSLAGLYLLNIIEAYIDARLKYFDVGEVTFKVRPGLIDSGKMYGFSPVSPGLKITLAL